MSRYRSETAAVRAELTSPDQKAMRIGENPSGYEYAVATPGVAATNNCAARGNHRPASTDVAIPKNQRIELAT